MNQLIYKSFSKPADDEDAGNKKPTSEEMGLMYKFTEENDHPLLPYFFTRIFFLPLPFRILTAMTKPPELEVYQLYHKPEECQVYLMLSTFMNGTIP
jgi:hypothetical protein